VTGSLLEQVRARIEWVIRALPTGEVETVRTGLSEVTTLVSSVAHGSGSAELARAAVHLASAVTAIEETSATLVQAAGHLRDYLAALGFSAGGTENSFGSVDEVPTNLTNRVRRAASKLPRPVPSGWTARIADNGKGVVFQRPAAIGNADMIRVMDATEKYPYGYVRIYNSTGQPVDISGKPGPPASTHISIDEGYRWTFWPEEQGSWSLLSTRIGGLSRCRTPGLCGSVSTGR
jgi:hypothetical protein